MDSPRIREEELSGHILRSSRKERLYHSLEQSQNASSHSFLRLSRTPKLTTHLFSTEKSSPSLLMSRMGDSDSHRFESTAAGFEKTSSIFYSKDDPGQEASLSLYSEFMELFLKYQGQHDMFELVNQYEQCCTKLIELLQKLAQQDPNASQTFSKTTQLLNLITSERNSWRLVRALTKDRIDAETCIDDDEMVLDVLSEKYISEKQIVDNLYKRDSIIRQAQLVVDWLEQNAADDLKTKNSHKMEYFTSNSLAWENTLHFLLSKKQGSDLYSSSKHKTITELDPDAPLRQQDAFLHESDREDEERLFKCMFTYIRAGQLSEAQRVAENFGSPWLAAALDGWKLHHDPNYERDPTESDDILPVEGNPYRDTWKLAIWTATSSEARLGHWERAVYGAFSGNLAAILPACTSWHDHLWAYTRVLVDVLMEQELRTMETDLFSHHLAEMPLAFWEKNYTFPKIFNEIEAHPNLQTDSKLPHNSVQKYVILNEMDQLAKKMHSWCNSSQDHLLRFMAHLILFLRSAGYVLPEESCTAVLSAYVQMLIKEKHNALVARYTATLPNPLQIYWYSKFLEGITETAERQQCLQWAEEAGLDVPLIAKTVVENIRLKESGTPDETTATSQTLSPETTEEDLQKIAAIDWLVFDPAQRAEAIKQANALMRHFVASNKLEAARQVFTKLPPDSIDVVIRHWKELTGSTELEVEDENATKEYLCFQAYLIALDAFNHWFEYYHNGMPQEPVPPPSGPGLRYTEWLAYEHNHRQYESDLERWKQSLDAQTKITKDNLYNVLLFVNGGWMVDPAPLRDDQLSKDGQIRKEQMSLLRQLCIPKITFLLHTVLSNSNRLQEAVQLSDILASERYQLYKEFSTQDLKTFLTKIKETSISLLNSNLDILGFPPS